ncbi:hypothetical protein [Corynebacterium callunae]|uniref:DUF8176 domain-containing protein n=1 Tax=Corynebacterium callunae DSM 20147 TaxID=1121353 RepID=M1UDV9_9CORY|nr:hypothetical protein [Corynebacterium callunae]AGG66180.1 hypothetical protein H924_03660 [Corynebacterium callunae DSM 20147]
MSSKWFELEDFTPRPEQNVDAVEPNDVAFEQETLAIKTPQKKRVSTGAFLAGAGGVLAVIVGVSVWAVMPTNSAADAQVEPSESEVPAASIVAATTEPSTEPSVMRAGTNCAGESTIDAGRESLEEAIVTFQTAYHERNADGVLAVVAQDSAMAAENWAEILPLAAPEGTTWCVTFSPESDTSVATDLTITDPAGKSVIYRQNITGAESDSGWILHKITERVDENA